MNESSHKLIWASLEGVSSPEEEEKVCREILSDRDMADAFAEQARMHASLEAFFNVHEAASFALEAASLVIDPMDSEINRLVGRKRFAWAAVALLALLPLIYLSLAGKKPAVQGYRLADGKLNSSQGTNEIIEGELLEVPANSQARIITPDGDEAALKSGTKVIFKGKVAHARQVIELHSAGGTFNVQPGRGEFRIETPVGHVVVLGTEFSVDLEPGRINSIPPEGECIMKTSAKLGHPTPYQPALVGTFRLKPALLAVAVVFGSVEVRIGDETFTLGAGASRVFAEEATRKLDADERKLASEFGRLWREAKAEKITKEDIGVRLEKIGITWQEGEELLKRAAAERGRWLAQRSAGERVLDRWTGTWLSAVTSKPARWSPQATDREEIKEVKWILNGRFQESSSRSDNHETRTTLRYDGGARRYTQWTFDTRGGHSYWLGDWDEESETMTWQFQSREFKGTMTDRFHADDRYLTSLLIIDPAAEGKDGKGKTLLDIQIDHMRIVKGASRRGAAQRQSFNRAKVKTRIGDARAGDQADPEERAKVKAELERAKARLEGHLKEDQNLKGQKATAERLKKELLFLEKQAERLSPKKREKVNLPPKPKTL